jgi:hypothetical protein
MSSLSKCHILLTAFVALLAEGYVWLVAGSPVNIKESQDRDKRNTDVGEEVEVNPVAPTFKPGITQGPLPIISDPLFSLIIFIYVAIVFLYMFYAFCWREPERPGPDPDAKDIPMITSMLEEMEKEVSEDKKEEKQDTEKMEKMEISEKNNDETTQL